MYAHSIPDFVLTLTNEPRYFGRIFKTNGPIKQPLDAKVHITRQIQKRYIANNGIQLWDLLCMARMANSRVIESKTVLFNLFINVSGILHPERVACGWRWIAHICISPTSYCLGLSWFCIYCLRISIGAPPAVIKQ